jgi:hypothetical protein
MMDHVDKETKVDPGDDGSTGKDGEASSYYYDDGTNYQTYRDDEEDNDDDSSTETQD